MHHLRGVGSTGVLVAIRGDDNGHMSRHVFRANVFVDLLEVLDACAHSVVESSVAASPVLVLCHGLNIFYADPVVEEQYFVIEEHGVHDDRHIAGLPLGYHAVESAYGIRLQSGHGTAAIEDEEHFCEIAVCHVKPPYTAMPLVFLVAVHMAKEVA